jgi:AcrR family transcriptional regulator
MADATPPNEPRREAILAAAYAQFTRYGYRRTSMEDIAREMGLSRGSLYREFANKEEIFRTLAASLHDDAVAAAETALKEPGAIADRVRDALAAKSARVLEVLHGSPHGAELMDESNRICGDLPAESQKQFQAMLTSLFRRAARAGKINVAGIGLSNTDTADLFVSAVAGLKGPGVSIPVYRKRVGAFVRLFLAGLRGSAARSSQSKGRGAGSSP